MLTGNLKRIAVLEEELAKHAAASELKLRSLRQEHERVKNGLQRQLEMSAGAAPGAGAGGVGVGAGIGGGGRSGSRREELHTSVAGSDGRDPQQQSVNTFMCMHIYTFTIL